MVITLGHPFRRQLHLPFVIGHASKVYEPGARRSRIGSRSGDHGVTAVDHGVIGPARSRPSYARCTTRPAPTHHSASRADPFGRISAGEHRPVGHPDCVARWHFQLPSRAPSSSAVLLDSLAESGQTKPPSRRTGIAAHDGSNCSRSISPSTGLTALLIPSRPCGPPSTKYRCSGGIRPVKRFRSQIRRTSHSRGVFLGTEGRPTTAPGRRTRGVPARAFGPGRQLAAEGRVAPT